MENSTCREELNRTTIVLSSAYLIYLNLTGRFTITKDKTSGLWKESGNSDGHQFHQYQQSERSPLILTKWTVTSHLNKVNGHLSS